MSAKAYTVGRVRRVMYGEDRRPVSMFVHWKNYSAKKDSWIGPENIGCPVEEFCRVYGFPPMMPLNRAAPGVWVHKNER